MKEGELGTATRDQLLEEVSRLRSLLWHAGVCGECGEEVHHDITEPFASCGCNFGEATVIPTIAALRHNLHLTSFMLFKFTDGLAVVKP